MTILRIPNFSLPPSLIGCVDSVHAHAKMDRIVKGFLLVTAGGTMATLTIVKVVVLSSLSTSLAVITALALITLGLQYLATSFEKTECLVQESPIQQLPDGILIKIFQELSEVEQKAKLLTVCKRWHQLLNDKSLWSQHLHQLYLDFNLTPIENPKNPSEEYNTMYLPFLLNLIRNKSTLLDTVNISFNPVVSLDGKTIVYEEEINHTINRRKYNLKKLRFSADGTKLIGIGDARHSRNKSFVIWDTNGKIVYHHAKIHHESYAISPNGNKIILWNNHIKPCQIKILDTNTNKTISFNPSLEDTNQILVAAFSYDETKILIGYRRVIKHGYKKCEKNLVGIWNLQSQKKIKEFSVKYSVSCLAFSQNGHKFAVGGFSNNGSTCHHSFFDVETEKELHKCVYDSPSDSKTLFPRSVEFLPKDAWAIVSYGFREKVSKTHRLYHVDSGKLSHTFTGIFTGSWKVQVKEKQLRTFAPQPPRIIQKTIWRKACEFFQLNPSMNILRTLVASLGKETQKESKALAEIPPKDGMCWMKELPEEVLLEIFKYIPPNQMGNLLLVWKQWNEVGRDDNLWKHHFFEHHPERAALTNTFTMQEYALQEPPLFLLNLMKDKSTKIESISKVFQDKAVSVSIDENHMAWGTKELCIKDLKKGTQKIYKSPIMLETLQYSADGSKIIGFGFEDFNTEKKRIVVWNANGDILMHFTPKSYSDAISPNLNYIISCEDEIMYLHDVERNCIKEQSYDQSLSKVIFSYDGTKILLVYVGLMYDKRIELWDVQEYWNRTSKSSPTMQRSFPEAIQCLAFSRDGEKIGLVNSSSFFLLEVSSGKCLIKSKYAIKKFHPVSIEFLPGDSWAVITTLYGSHHLLNVETGKIVHTFEGTFTSSYKVKVEKDDNFKADLLSFTPQTKQPSLWEKF